MTKQYKYIEHENIIDVAKTIHDKQHIFQKRGDDYFMVNIWADGIFPDHQYYKRVEIKDTKTVEAWAVVNDDAEVIALSPDGCFKGGTLPMNELLKLVKLTGTVKD